MRSGLGDDGVVLLEQSDILTLLKTVPEKRKRGLMTLRPEYVVNFIGLRSNQVVCAIITDKLLK